MSKLSDYSQNKPFTSHGIKIYLTASGTISVNGRRDAIFHGNSNAAAALKDFIEELLSSKVTNTGWHTDDYKSFTNGEWKVVRTADDTGWYLSNESVPKGITFFPDNWEDLMEDTIHGVLDRVMVSFEGFYKENRLPTELFSVVEAGGNRFTLLNSDRGLSWYAGGPIGGNTFFSSAEVRELGEVTVLFDAGNVPVSV